MTENKWKVGDKLFIVYLNSKPFEIEITEETKYGDLKCVDISSGDWRYASQSDLNEANKRALLVMHR